MRRSPPAQTIDEVGEVEEAAALDAFGGEDRHYRGDAAVEMIVDHDVIVFRPVAGLVEGFPHPAPLHIVAVLRARFQAPLQDAAVRRQDEDPVSYTHLRAHETGRNLVCRLLLEKKK